MSKKQFETYVDFKLKSVHGREDEEEDKDFITIEGFANTTTVDRVGDIILEEAWTKGGLSNYLKNPIILAYHNQNEPIGKMTDYSVNEKGFKITANILKDTKVHKLIKNEILRTFSVGFRTKEADYDKDTDIFVIKDLELMEISVVSVPANVDSTFSVRKSFETDEEYTSFKSEFIEDTDTVITENVSDDNSDNIEEKVMPDKTKAEIEAQIRADIEKEIKEKAAAAVALKDEVTAQVKDSTSTVVETVGEKVEELKKEIETRLEDDSKTMQETLEEIKSTIKEYAEDLTNLSKSKMSFQDKNKGEFEFTTREMDDAVLIAKIVGLPIEETKFGQQLVQKSDQEHLGSTSDKDWEENFSLRLYDDIREKLIVEALFTNFAMPNVSMNLPLNPEAGYGTWVTNAEMNAATSSGTTRIHAPSDTTITAFKLATKELLGYEEEDDSLIALVPLIRDAAVRRMAKSSDKALLLGNVGASAGSGEGNYPFDGLATIAQDASRTTQIAGTLAAPTAIKVSDLAAMRRLMGVHGHTPSDIIFVVSHEIYFDLLEDADFRTLDKVGPKATILTGQVGFVSGSPVVVSGEFAAPAADLPAAICVNMTNYIKGVYKGIKVERERSVEFQTNLLVVTRRFGMLQLFANATVVTLENPSS